MKVTIAISIGSSTNRPASSAREKTSRKYMSSKTDHSSKINSTNSPNKHKNNDTERTNELTSPRSNGIKVPYKNNDNLKKIREYLLFQI